MSLFHCQHTTVKVFNSHFSFHKRQWFYFSSTKWDPVGLQAPPKKFHSLVTLADDPYIFQLNNLVVERSGPFGKTYKITWAGLTKYHQVDLVTSGNILQVKDETSPAQLDVNTTPDSPSQKTNSDNPLCGGSIFNASWGPQQTSLWLQANRYSSHLTTLSSYSGIDLLRLSKDNLTQLCGLPDGIRLYNALHSRTAVLTIYVCIDIREQVYQAVYLSSCTSNELIHKMSAALGLSVPQIAAVYVRGPNNIKIIITDELVTHLPDQSAYTISVLQDGPDKYQLLLKLSEQRISSDSIPSG